MRVINYTQLPQAELNSLLEFAARGVNDAGVELHIKNEPHHPHGYCYPSVPSMANVAETTRMLITLHLPSTADSNRWPKAVWNGHSLKRIRLIYPHVPFDGWRDCTVYIAAHEFRHCWQEDRRQRCKIKGRRPSGKGEHDAEKHAIRILNLWRVSTGRTAIAPVKQPNPFAREPALA